MKNKKALLAIFSALMLFVLTACGPSISTTLTVNDGFSGNRVTTFDFNVSSGGLDKIEGGFESVTEIVTKNIPSEMTFTASDNKLVFDLAFTSKDEYVKKVTSILKAGEVETIPTITYQNHDSLFKKGNELAENFSSYELFKWFENAMDKAGIVSESDKSNWYSKGSTEVVLNGETYSSDFTIGVAEYDANCFDSIDSTTTFKNNGKFDRTIVFNASYSMIEKFEEQGKNLDEFMNSIKPENAEYDVKKNSDDVPTYTYTVTDVDAQGIVDFTNKLMQNTDTVFTVEVLKEDVKDLEVELKTTDRINASFFLNESSSSYGKINSTYYMYGDMSINKFTKNSSYSEGNGKVTFRQNSKTTYTMEGDCEVSLDTCVVELDISSEDNVSIEFKFSSPSFASDEIKNTIKEKLSASISNGKFDEKDGMWIVSFSGTPYNVQSFAELFINKYNDGTDAKCELEITESTSAKPYQKVYIIEPTIDFGDMFTNDYYQLISSDFEKEVENGHSVSATIVKINVVNIVLFAIFALCLIGGIVLIVLKHKDFPLAIAAIKQSSANKQAAAAQTVAQAPVENATQPVTETQTATVANVVQEQPQVEQTTTPVSENESYEEEIL